MTPQGKSWLAAAAILLLAGAGCQSASVQQEAQVETSGDARMEVKEEDGAKMEKSGDADVDAAVDIYLEGAVNEDASATEEDKDASMLNSTDAEINAYGQVYDKSEF